MLEVDTAQLIPAMTALATVAKKHSGAAILSTLLFEPSGDGELTISGTDLDGFMSIKIGASGLAPPKPFVMVDHASVRHAIDTIQSHKALIDVTADAAGPAGVHRIAVESGPLKIDMPLCFDSDDFPCPIKITRECYRATISKAALEKMLRPWPSMSREETRYYLNGLCMSPGPESGWIVTAATDGQRLFESKVEIVAALADPGLPPNTIIPRRAVKFMRNVLASADEVLLTIGDVKDESSKHRSFDPQQMLIRIEAEVEGREISYQCRSIDGVFPDYQRVIPKNPDGFALFDRVDLLRAARALSIKSSSDWPHTVISFERKVVTAGGDIDGTGVSVELRGVEYDKTPAKIAFKTEYLISILEAMKGETVKFHFSKSDAGSPVLIEDPRDLSLLMVQMPMRV